MPDAHEPRTVVFFDFDGTLAEGDSLWPFLIAARGRARCYAALFLAVFAYLVTPLGRDRRTVVKDKLLKLTLGGVKLSALAPAVARMKKWPRWIEGSFEALRQHHAAGAVIVIASGSLDLYMKAMLQDALPYHELICTEMEVVNGVLTGRMLKGNCVRATKARRVAEYIASSGPFADSWAYGNAPHDLPMMELTKNRVVV